MAMSGGKDDGSPMMEMNTTPLIDVMLVLLIMFIITIPVATHSLDIDLPPPPPPSFVPPPTNPVRNKVVVMADGTLVWNTSGVSAGELVSLLEATTKMDPEPELQFQPEADAGYETTSKVLSLIKQTKVTKFGFFGNESYSEFNRAANSPKP
jgi:biopolymer transport protein ExbD